jgi:O-acetyl-ADP-ribose deacetylase (regulator of RNase III)
MADARLILVRGDITKLAVDAIVNAANTTLLGGGGVDGAIHRAAGPELLAECKTLGGCRPGEAKITRGYSLPARFVIHTVGPIWSGGHHGESETLGNCYRNSLRLASENGLRTIAFPAISCGVYRYPIPEAARIAVETTSEFLRKNASITEVTFVVSSDEIEGAYQRLLAF